MEERPDVDTVVRGFNNGLAECARGSRVLMDAGRTLTVGNEVPCIRQSLHETDLAGAQRMIRSWILSGEWIQGIDAY